MKKTFLATAIVSALLIGCNETKHKQENKETVDATEAVHQARGEEMAATNNAWVSEINMDNGNKWDANQETTKGVDKMLDMIKIRDISTVEDYHRLASDLNKEKNYVVKKCTMKGPSHDNLHIFLHPLIEKIDALGKISTVKDASALTESIKENLEGYYNYFQ